MAIKNSKTNLDRNITRFTREYLGSLASAIEEKDSLSAVLNLRGFSFLRKQLEDRSGLCARAFNIACRRAERLIQKESPVRQRELFDIMQQAGVPGSSIPVLPPAPAGYETIQNMMDQFTALYTAASAPSDDGAEKINLIKFGERITDSYIASKVLHAALALSPPGSDLQNRAWEGLKKRLDLIQPRTAAGHLSMGHHESVDPAIKEEAATLHKLYRKKIPLLSATKFIAQYGP